MKNRMVLMLTLAAIVFVGCVNEKEDKSPVDGGVADVAYISLQVKTEKNEARSSGENAGMNESDLKTLYLITFDETEKVVGIPKTTEYYTKIENAASKPDAIKISAASEKLLVIANPGDKLLDVIENINDRTTFSTINAAVKEVTMAEITDKVDAIAKGFTMINSGNESGKQAGDKITDPLISLVGKIQVVSKDLKEENAIEEAEKEGNRVDVKIERLASKVELKLKGDNNDNVVVEPTGATFTFKNWTLDVVNSTFYPFAEKTLLTVIHSSGGSYVSNFYTKDPNFTDATGIVNASVNQTTYEPELVAPYSWMAAANGIYCIENTMNDNAQIFENATRVVIKGIYYPENHVGTGDWFSFAGKTYANFDDLKVAYNASDVGPNLKAACEAMYSSIRSYADKHSDVNLSGTSFKTLETSDLAQVKNGGEVLKNGKTPVIQWYQEGLCYYYYEIRHDNDTDEHMAFGKYGVVRNNWYKLTLGLVKGPGTPWFPDIDNPGPGDPDPDDPIDTSTGYLGITVEVAPWIIWENEIDI